ncbi:MULTISPECIES: 2-dehydropantoate 2-reductase [Geobacillus]|uniref:2-dehydropantoate 2-reductase n=1 Tax=Geobacillus zalihae TaxID=213419 RepID=A0A7H1RVQ8_9BACL|nr:MULTISPECIES: 2-dehydropantoate 2-reductase [Geobacillus]EPR28075.1 2-dehydropantoate 2-reductase [Geobacillus sp. WSUCF1]OQP24738.1 2-dehydropantoate 2-reductase [Geobacillus zalihae]QNU18347.1 2-dehydropantoate 2-reductase [Geobacillus zalihae]
MLQESGGEGLNIGIVGGGAIGLLLAAYLGRRHGVTVYTRRPSQARQLAEHGVALKKDGETSVVAVRAQPFAGAELDEPLVFVTVKQYDLASVCAQIDAFRRVRTLVFLQNGMGHLEQLTMFADKNVLVGVVEHGAMKLDDRTVAHTGAGKLTLASCYGSFGDAWELREGERGFPIEWADDWERILVDKLVVNAVINPLTALLQVKNGALLETAPYRDMMRQLFDEVRNVLPLEDANRAWERVVRICQKTADNYSSMYMDLANGRRTEIDAILGYVLKQGEARGAMLPVVRFVFCAVKGKEGGETDG